MTGMSIGEIARQAGVSTSAIRYYESIGLLPAPPRISGHRRYDSSVLNSLAIIRAAQSAGWTLAEIQELFSRTPDHKTLSTRWKALAPKKIAELDIQIQKAQRLKQTLADSLNCECRTVEDCSLAIFSDSLS